MLDSRLGRASGRSPFNPANPLSVSATTPWRLLRYLMFIPRVHVPEMIVAMHRICVSKDVWHTVAIAPQDIGSLGCATTTVN